MHCLIPKVNLKNNLNVIAVTYDCQLFGANVMLTTEDLKQVFALYKKIINKSNNDPFFNKDAEKREVEIHKNAR